MDDDSSRGSWWKTLPGVLTAVGALVTALVGGVVGLKQAGIIFTEAKPPVQGEMGRADRPVALPQHAGPEPPSATAPQSAAAPLSAPTPSAHPVPSVSPDLDQVRVSDAIYKILATGVEPYDSERLRLRFTVRLTSQTRAGHNFWSRSFRLLVDSIPRAPENLLNEVVEQDAAKEGEVIFVFPRTARSLVLKIASGGEDALIPLQLKP
jgi:hypothetical protein